MMKRMKRSRPFSRLLKRFWDFDPKDYVFCILICLPGAGTTPTFQNLTAADMNMIAKDFSGESNFSTVSPASSLGDLGIEIGLQVGQTNTPDIQSLVAAAGGSADLSRLPHAAIFGALTIPYGLTASLAYFPSRNIEGVNYEQLGAALKWTITDNLLTDLPLDLAIQLKYSNTKLQTSQIIDNASTGNTPVTANISLDDTVYGAEFMVSKELFIFEPYLTLGYLRGSGALAVEGQSTATVFAPSFTDGQSANAGATSAEMIVGLNAYIYFVALGAEYVRAFDVNTVNGKLSFQF
jgi:hypothetical protein